jgi:ABC-2 type transport system ATP-binding protein
MDALVVDQLTKRYGRIAALDGLSFSVPAGSVCGFLGPNGAGKTTTLRILLGLASATSGSVRVDGRVAGVLDRDGFHPARSARDELRLAAARAGRTDGDADAALERAGLEGVAERAIKACSFGTRRRLALAAALLAEPDVLVLDEPATGLDPHALRALRQRLRELAAAGGTVLLSSHVLEEVAATCDRVVVVNRGRRVADGELQDLLASRIRIRSPERDRLLAALAHRGLHALPESADAVIVSGSDVDVVGRAVRDSGAVIHEMSTHGALEALYVGLTEAA